MKTLLAATALLAAMAGPALAQDADAEYRRDCTADYSRFCSAYDPGSQEVQQCFRARRKELSPRCQATIAKYERRR